MVNVTGSCLCGGVAFEVTGPLREIIACHCKQCQKTSGHHVAATSCMDADLVFTSHETLTWYRSSDFAARGFCNRCGGNLFYKHDERPTTSIMAGMLDTPTGLEIAKHIFCADKSDFYAINDGLPQFEQHA